MSSADVVFVLTFMIFGLGASIGALVLDVWASGSDTEQGVKNY